MKDSGRKSRFSQIRAVRFGKSPRTPCSSDSMVDSMAAQHNHTYGSSSEHLLGSSLG